MPSSDALDALTATITAPKKVLFVLSMAGGKVQVAGTDTAANGVITMAGAVNAVTDYAGYKALTDEAIITAAPDVILMMDRGGGRRPCGGGRELFGHPAIGLTPAGQNTPSSAWTPPICSISARAPRRRFANWAKRFTAMR